MAEWRERVRKSRTLLEAYGMSSSEVGRQPYSAEVVKDIRDDLESWVSTGDSLRTRLKEMYAAAQASPGLQKSVPALRAAISALDTVESSLDYGELHTALNDLSIALGGSGVSYFR